MTRSRSLQAFRFVSIVVTVLAPCAALAGVGSPTTDQPGEQPASERGGSGEPAYEWKVLPTEPSRGKQDDIEFATALRGWYVSGLNGRIYRTDDGGETWTKQTDKPGTFWRCLAFVDERTGFAGNIGPDYFPNVSDATPLYRTTDGGETWSPVEIAGDPVKGLCALQVVRTPFINAGQLDTRVTIVGVGRVGGPTVFVRSDDGGSTWTATDMREHAGMLLDVHFFDDRRGLVAASTSSDVTEGTAMILMTEDGGKSWRTAYKGDRPFENVWKLSFPTPQVGFGSVQSYDPDPAASQRFVVKTTDGGRTWSEMPLVDDHRVRPFGIGFVDERTGWVGAMPGGFETRDGGRTWKRTEMGRAGNKVRVVRDGERTRVYAVGVEVLRLTLPTASDAR